MPAVLAFSLPLPVADSLPWSLAVGPSAFHAVVQRIYGGIPVPVTGLWAGCVRVEKMVFLLQGSQNQVLETLP